MLNQEKYLENDKRAIKGSHVLVINLIIILFVFFAGDLLNIPISNDAIVYFLTWSLIAIMCFFFAKKASFSAKLNKSIDILEIPIYISITNLGLISSFGLIPYFDSKVLLPQLNSASEILNGLILNGVGLLCLWLGYILVVNSKISLNSKLSTAKQSEYSPSLVKTLILFFIVLALRIILIINGDGERIGSGLERSLGDWQQWLTYIITLKWFFLALFTIKAAAKEWSFKYFIFVVIAEVFIAIISGWSSSLLKIGFLVFACFIYSERRLPIKTLILVAIPLVAMVPVTRFMRLADWTSVETIWNSVQEGFEIYSSSDANVGFTQDLLVERQSAIAQTQTLIMNMTPSLVPYRPVEEILAIPISIIPRALWPSKPAFGSIGSFVSEAYFGRPENTGSSAVTMVGNAYMYGGIPVVILSMFTIGILSALFYRQMIIFPSLFNHLGLKAIYAATIINNLHLGEGDIAGLWQGLFQGTLVYLFVLFIISTKDKPINHPLCHNESNNFAVKV